MNILTSAFKSLKVDLEFLKRPFFSASALTTNNEFFEILCSQSEELLVFISHVSITTRFSYKSGIAHKTLYFVPLINFPLQ